MTWRVARSLDKLLAQLNAMYPNRSKVSDGSIGDAEHASRSSDHNAWYRYPNPDPRGIVTARDFTHKPPVGIDCHKLAAWLVASGDRRIKYVIWDRRIWERGTGWVAYHGPNPHTKHLHLSVVASPACDDSTAWKLGAVAPTQPEEDDDLALNDKLPPVKMSDGRTYSLTVADVLHGLAQQIPGNGSGAGALTPHPTGQLVSRILAADAIKAELAGLRVAVDKLAGAVGGDKLTAAELRAAVAAGVADGLADAVVDVDVNVNGKAA